MRTLSFAVVALSLSLAAPAYAQAEWGEFTNQPDHFKVNFPGQPAVKDLDYKTAKGTTLKAHEYTAKDRRGEYTMTVVDYRTASADEQKAAIAEAADKMRAEGMATYDEPGMIDNHLSQRITIETPAKRRILGEILMSQDKRLYISEADTDLVTPPPAQFQASIQVLDDQGRPIRYKAVGSFERAGGGGGAPAGGAGN